MAKINLGIYAMLLAAGMTFATCDAEPAYAHSSPDHLYAVIGAGGCGYIARYVGDTPLEAAERCFNREHDELAAVGRQVAEIAGLGPAPSVDPGDHAELVNLTAFYVQCGYDGATSVPLEEAIPTIPHLSARCASRVDDEEAIRQGRLLREQYLTEA